MRQQVDTAESARELAALLQRRGRTKPAVVVSIAGGRTEPFVDVDVLESELDGLCDIYVLPTGSASWAYANALPEGRQVYGGASRVYGTDLEWVADQYASPLRFAYGPGDRAKVTELLVGDALTAVHRDRLQAPPQSAGRVERYGTVRGIVGGRALVDLDSGGKPFPATVHHELVAPGVPVDRMFARGQRVTGLYDAEANRLDVEASVVPPLQAFATVLEDDVLLAEVTRIGTKYATVRLLPGVEVRVSLDEFGEDDPGMGHLVTVGEVLPVAICEITAGVPTGVEVRPTNYADLATSVAILPGGPEWLTRDQVGAAAETVTVAPEPDSADDGAAIDPTDPAAPLLVELAGLRRRLRTSEREVEVLKQRIANAKTAARTRKQELKAASEALDAARSNRASTGRVLFEDPADQFRHEVYVEWAERTTPQDKLARPWKEPTIGPDFLTTLDAVEGVDRSKVVEVVADVISGHAEQQAGRAMHQLRRGEGANDPVVTREDGATCWRVYLQHKTPSARRLHFWRLSGGTIELSSVRLHDDNRP